MQCIKGERIMKDIIYRDDAIALVIKAIHGTDNKEIQNYLFDGLRKQMWSLPSAEAIQGWIPIEWHEITEEEREREDYPKDWVCFLDCVMPQDNQEILVQTQNGEIRWDVCYEEDGFILDSGWDWIDDIVAWMPLPKPYKGGDSE